ncbi:MAG: hypothetical protein JWN26_520 [Candidatus Saccharibacteria bacterium]|nr:hypothetical protein [Candidatus Saccharibacteria bacterium]
MIFPTEAKFDEGIKEILENDVRGRSLDHLKILAMQLVVDGLREAQANFSDDTNKSQIRRDITGHLIDSFAGDTEFSIGNEIEITDRGYYLLHDVMTNYFVVARLEDEQKLAGVVETTVAINSEGLTDIESKVGQVVEVGGETLADTPAILLGDLRFVTSMGKAHAIKPQYRALIVLNKNGPTPRQAVPQESNAFFTA